MHLENLRGAASRTALVAALLAFVGPVAAEEGFSSDELLVSRTQFPTSFNAVDAGTTQLPPGCVATNCVTAVAGSTYPLVFNNAPVDGSFGLTSKIVLDRYNPEGRRVGSIEIPNNLSRGVTSTSDQMVTSFSSKSELALNLSADGRYLTFTGYLAPVGAVDVSNSNTPGVVDATNPVPSAHYRLVATMDARGHLRFTKTNAYSGNNSRAAIFENTGGLDEFLMSGNAGNGANPQPNGVILGAGAQFETPNFAALANQPDPGQPTPVGSFNITQLGDKADKIGKDTNFRGLTVFDNVVYFTKGSGGNGINTVYFIDTSGVDTLGRPLACPNGVGVPAAGAKLPSAAMSYTASALQTAGVSPYNMCVLKGFPTTLAKTATAFPFGVWFANATTLYVADEGAGATTYANGVFTGAAASATAGLQKWVYNAAQGQWTLAYVLQAGLNLGVPYTVANYPTGINTSTKLPWAPATEGLRNITGRVNRDGTATIFAITSTVSGSGDQGADPNSLVAIKDSLAATTLPASESFNSLRVAKSGEALRGVSFAPGGETHGSGDGWQVRKRWDD